MENDALLQQALLLRRHHKVVRVVFVVDDVFQVDACGETADRLSLRLVVRDNDASQSERPGAGAEGFNRTDWRQNSRRRDFSFWDHQESVWIPLGGPRQTEHQMTERPI